MFNIICVVILNTVYYEYMPTYITYIIERMCQPVSANPCLHQGFTLITL